MKPEKDELSADKGSDRVRESFGTSSQPSLHGVTDCLTVALPNSAEKEASVDQLMGSPRQKLSHSVPGLNNRTVFVPTAGLPAVEVIAGPGKDAQREGGEGQRK